ncbi:MAG: penicillin acylase family protein [bacterium]|nr:penicillin acylase family protein [bacterium]
MKKKIFFTSLAIVLLLILLLGGGGIFFYSRNISYNHEFVSSVQSGVVIQRDSRGIPQIEVDSENDIYFALGYLHAQDRLILMDYYRAIANGNISHLIGEQGAPLGKLARIIGFSRKALELEKKIDPKSLSFIKAYVDGINLVRKENLHTRVLQSDWQSVDVIKILLLREWANAFISNKEIIFQLPETKRLWSYRELFPPDLLSFYSEEEESSVKITRDMKQLVQKYIGTFNRGFAFHIPGNKTKKGEPFCGFNIDSNPGLYPCLYPVHIKLSNSTIQGISYAGLPFIFAGKNKDISFFGFNLNTDTQDFVISTIRTRNDIQQYQGKNGWTEFKAVREPVSVQGNENIHEVIWSTENGPVLNDIFNNEQYKSAVITSRSFFPGESYISSLFTIPFAKNLYEAQKAVRLIDSFPRVYLFVSKESAIRAYSGKIPAGASGDRVLTKGLYAYQPVYTDLSMNSYQSRATVIADSSFHQDAPFIVKARSITDTNRYNRLMDRINSTEDIDTAGVQSFIRDRISIYAEKFTPLYISILKNNPVTSARLSRIYFQEWDYSMSSNRVAPSIFHFLLWNCINETFADDLEKDMEHTMKNYHHLIDNFYTMMEKGSSFQFDDSKTKIIETRDMIFDRAFLKTMRQLNRKQGPIMEDWQWGSVHKGHFYIPIQEDSLINRTLYTIKSTGFEGGLSTVYSGSGGEEISGERSSCTATVLSGYFGHTEAAIHLNFTYSINPRSEFYYGEEWEKKFVDFERFKGIYLTRIMPMQ